MIKACYAAAVDGDDNELSYVGATIILQVLELLYYIYGIVVFIYVLYTALFH